MIPLVKPFLPSKEVLMPKLEKVLYSGQIGQGALVNEFENRFQAYIGSGFSLAVNSGTSALHLALILAGVGPGDEVISTPLTAEPTNAVIKMVGAKIRWADIDFSTGNISPESIENNINESTKAIIVVDYAGIPVDAVKIQSISNKYNIPVIEDCAHALGAEVNNLKTGNLFPYTVFSFQAIKHLTTVDGGILHLHNETQFEKAKLLRWFGLNKNIGRLENNIKVQGFKYNMNDVTATIGLVQLENLDKLISKYVENGKFLDKNLSKTSGVELIKYYPNTKPSYWLYTLKVENRSRFIEYLRANNITASELHRRNDLHEFFNDFPADLPNLNKFYTKMVHIPCGWWVNEKDLNQMIRLIKTGW